VEVAFETVCRGREARPGFRGQVQPHYWNIPVDKFANGMMVFSRRIDQEERWALPGSRGKNGGRRNVGGTVACHRGRPRPAPSLAGAAAVKGHRQGMCWYWGSRAQWR
jgi:hypothetical protein